MRKKLFIAVTLVLAFVNASFAQNDSTRNLTISGYVETYFSYDFNKPDNGNRPSFLYNFNRHKEVNLNLGIVKAAYSDAVSRANIALMTGTYTSANLSNEPNALQHIYEANAGIKIAKKSNVWLDMGIFSSHIGFESAIGKDCWNLTRSLAAENSPYYESGAKLTLITKNEKWLLSALLLNGWQQIYRPNSGNALAYGTQIQWKPNKKWTFNSSSFFNKYPKNSYPESRLFHNFYLIYLSKNNKFGWTFGIDNGREKLDNFGIVSNAKWSTIVNSLKVSPNDKWTIAARIEFYKDVDGRIIPVPDGKTFDADGFSINVDYKISKNAVWRNEWRSINNNSPIFTKNNKFIKSNRAFTTAIAVSF
jgi:hypothetical protein